MAHFLIVVANYYRDIADELVLGAKTHLQVAEHTYDIQPVPGAFEIPAAITFALDSKKAYDGFVALGCVVRGETSHFDFVCQGLTQGLQLLTVQRQAAIGFGVLTVESKPQAQKRASVNGGNKGREAAEAAMQLVAFKQSLGL